MCSAAFLPTDWLSTASLSCHGCLKMNGAQMTFKVKLMCIVLLSLVGKNEGEEKRELIFKEDGQGEL